MGPCVNTWTHVIIDKNKTEKYGKLCMGPFLHMVEKNCIIRIVTLGGAKRIWQFLNYA